ncbi:1380_t:CDS:1, partial [Paraglomus occultum]
MSWDEIFHPDRPRKVADLLWKIAHNSLPLGHPVAMVAMDGPYCPWCPNTLNNIPHLFWNCPTSIE